MQRIEIDGVAYLLIKESDYLEGKEGVELTTQRAISSLSCMELDSAKVLFEKLENEVTDIILTTIAVESNVTNGVVSMMLRKLESHNILECSSMGSKGTRIKLLNKDFKNRLANI